MWKFDEEDINWREAEKKSYECDKIYINNTKHYYFLDALKKHSCHTLAYYVQYFVPDLCVKLNPIWNIDYVCDLDKAGDEWSRETMKLNTIQRKWSLKVLNPSFKDMCRK